MNKVLDLLYLFASVILLFIVSWYMPFNYKIYDSSIFVKLDLFMLFLLFQSFIDTRFKLILIGFLIGFLNDVDLESNFLGINSFLNPILCYFLGFLRLNSSNWDLNFKAIYCMALMITYAVIKFSLYDWGMNFFDVISIVFNAVLVLFTILSIDRYYYKGRLIN